MGSYWRGYTAGCTGPIGEPGPPQPEFPEAVDLGLPSGTLWASYNLGGNDPISYGKYYSWANIEGHLFPERYDFSESNYMSTKGSSIVGRITWENDAAFFELGGNWMIPSTDHFEELLQYTKQEWITGYLGFDVNGTLFRSLVNENSIFIPAAGYVSGTSRTGSNKACELMNSVSDSMTSYARLHLTNSVRSLVTTIRFYGMPIRPIIAGSQPFSNSPSFQSLALINDDE